MMKRNLSITSPKQQHGSMLIFSLLLVLVMSMLLFSSTSNTALELRMTSNIEDRNRAFQAAQHALRIGEQKIEDLMATTSGLTTFGTVTGYYKGLQESSTAKECNSNPMWTLANAKWDSTDSVEVGISATAPFDALGLSANPRFMIGFEGETDTTSVCYSSTAATGYSDSIGNTTETVEVLRFTITAVGYGSLPGTRVRLQETWSVAQ